MIAVDTNILVYAHRADSEWHTPARQTLVQLAEGQVPWAIPWPCLHEFFAIATHPAVYNPPSTTAAALGQVDAWLASPTCSTLAEGTRHWLRISDLARKAKLKGPKIHDARIAAICLENGVSQFLTADRDFSQFPDLHTRNPLL